MKSVRKESRKVKIVGRRKVEGLVKRMKFVRIRKCRMKSLMKKRNIVKKNIETNRRGMNIGKNYLPSSSFFSSSLLPSHFSSHLKITFFEPYRSWSSTATRA